MAPQDASFVGGERLKAWLDDLSKKLDAAATLRVGFLEGATYPDGTSVAMVAAIQEYGAPSAGIPPRPFMRPTVAEGESHWGEDLAKILAATGWDVDRSLGIMGARIASQIQAHIIAVDSPPLSEVTLMLRAMRSKDQSLVVTAKTVGEAARRVAAGETSGLSGTGAKPLVDTGYMLSRVDYEVTAS